MTLARVRPPPCRRPTRVDPAGNLRGAREAIAATGAVSGGQVDEAVAWLGALAREPGAAVWYAFPWAEGIREA